MQLAGGALLMDVNSGEILSLVSLPNFNINERSTINDTKYINKITKGVYELGSIFKTFTIALALDHKLVDPTQSLKIFQEILNVQFINYRHARNIQKI